MPITWTIEDYPFLSAIGQGGTVGMQSGTQLNVPADGSSYPTVTFATPFATAPVVVGDPNTTSQTSEQLSIGFFNIAQNAIGQYVSFQISVVGGKPGTTINVGWIATNGS